MSRPAKSPPGDSGLLETSERKGLGAKCTRSGARLLSGLLLGSWILGGPAGLALAQGDANPLSDPASGGAAFSIGRILTNGAGCPIGQTVSLRTLSPGRISI